MSNRKEYELVLQIKSAMGGNFKGTFNTASESVRGLQNKLADLRKVQGDVSAYQKTEKAIADLKAKKEELIQAGKEHTNATENVNRKIAEQEQKLAGLSDKLRGAGVDTNNLAAESAKLGEEYDKLKAKQENLANLDRWEQQNAAALSRARADFLKTSAVVAGAGAAFYKGFIEPAAEFEAEMSNIAALTGYNAEQMKRLKDETRDTAVAIGMPVNELSSKVNMLVETGGDLDLVLEQMKHGVNLAKATGTDVGAVYDFTSAAMKTFELEASETQAVMDSLAYTTSLTNLSLSQIAESYVNVSGSAHNARLEMNDVNAMLLVMSEAGLKGGAAGTSLNAVLRNLSTPTDKAAGALKDLGVELYDTEGASRDMFDVMGDLERKLSTLTDEQRNHEQSVIFDTVALKGWNMITAEGIDTVRELSGDIGGASEMFGGLGQSAGMAGVKIDNLKGDMALNKAVLKDLSMTIGDIFLPQMREGVQEMTAMLKVGGEWVKENPEKVKQIVDTAAKLAVLTVGLKGAKLGYFALKGEIIGIRKLAAGATVDKGRLAKSAQTLVKGLKFMGPAGIVAVGALAAITAAIVINKKQMEELRKLYVDPLLFDNGGKKLSEFTDNLIESTRRSYEHAQAVNASKERISEIRGEIQRASGDLDFYGWSLRTNGILAPHEAEAMIEPFNRLAESLEENFQVRFTNVFDAFKIASTQVAENLGVDVAHISSILDGFKAKYTQNVSEARATTNAHLERVATGENLTAEDWEEYTRAMAYIRDSEAAASGEAREYEKIKENLSSIDFGSDYKEAIAEIRRLAEYADEYKNTLLEAQRTLDDDFAHLREQAKIDFEYGYKTAGELQNELDALQIAQHMTQLSTNQRIKDLDAEVGLFAGRMEGQVNFAEAKMLENAGGIKSHFVSLGASFQTGFGLWGNSYEQYVKNTVGGVFDVTRELEDLRKSTENSPLIIPIELDDSALRRFAARMPQRGDEYYMRHMGYVPKIHGSHAGGLDYVPFDGYRAELHKGERVLTAAESRDLFSLFNEFRPRPASSVGVKPLGISVADSSGKNITVKIEYAPNINFSGNPPEDLEEILRRNNEHLADEIEEKMRGVAEFELRSKYG